VHVIEISGMAQAAIVDAILESGHWILRNALLALLECPHFTSLRASHWLVVTFAEGLTRNLHGLQVVIDERLVILFVAIHISAKAVTNGNSREYLCLKAEMCLFLVEENRDHHKVRRRPAHVFFDLDHERHRGFVLQTDIHRIVSTLEAFRGVRYVIDNIVTTECNGTASEASNVNDYILHPVLRRIVPRPGADTAKHLEVRSLDKEKVAGRGRGIMVVIEGDAVRIAGASTSLIIGLAFTDTLTSRPRKAQNLTSRPVRSRPIVETEAFVRSRNVRENEQ